MSDIAIRVENLSNKILSRITEPTSGRVGSLLEVGTGFHPELTGHLPEPCYT